MSYRLMRLRRSRVGSQIGIETRKHDSVDYLGPILLAWCILVLLTSPVIGFTSAISILMFTGLVLAVVGLVWGGAGILGIGILCTVDSIARSIILMGGLLRFNTFNYWLLIIVVLSIPFLLWLNDAHMRFFEIFLAILIVELVYSSNKTSGILDVLNLIGFLGLIVYFSKSAGKDAFYYWMGLINGVIAGVGSIFYFLQQSNLPYVNPNGWAFFPLTAIFSICLAFPHLGNSNRKRFVFLALAGLNMIWVFLSSSRGGMLMGLCCLVFLIFYLRSLSWTSILVVIIAAASLWMSMQFADQQYLSLTRINKLFNSDLSSGERTSGRSVIAMAGIEVFLEHPLGVGTGGFKEAVAEVGWFGDEGRMAHSAWIKILGENGFPGLLAFFLFIGSYAVVGWLKKEKDLLLIGLLVTVVLSVGFLAHELQGKGLWFLAAGGSTFLHKDQLVDYMQYSRKNRLVKRYAARLNDKSGEIHAAN